MIPFTLESETVAPGADGALRVTEHRITAVRADGSEVWLSTLYGKKSSGLVRRIIRPDGRVTVAIDAIGATISRYLPASSSRGRKSLGLDKGADCRFPYEDSGGTREVAGIRASVSEYKSTPTDRRTILRALDYGCVTVGIRIERLVDGDWKLSAESVPMFFRGGEPSEELFDESYYDALQEMSPSEARRNLYVALGVSESECPACYGLRSLSE